MFTAGKLWVRSTDAIKINQGSDFSGGDRRAKKESRGETLPAVKPSCKRTKIWVEGERRGMEGKAEA